MKEKNIVFSCHEPTSSKEVAVQNNQYHNHNKAVLSQWSLKMEKPKRSGQIPSRRASQTSSIVTLSALNEIAIFCDFLGSSTLFSVFGDGITERGVVSFGFKFELFTMNNVSIISSFNLQPT